MKVLRNYPKYRDWDKLRLSNSINLQWRIFIAAYLNPFYIYIQSVSSICDQKLFEQREDLENMEKEVLAWKESIAANYHAFLLPLKFNRNSWLFNHRFRWLNKANFTNKR